MKTKQPENNMELEVMRAFNSRKTDQEIAMPDVEMELSRLKARRQQPSPFVGSSWVHSLRKVAAILVAALVLTGLSYAAVHTLISAPSNSTKVEEECQASTALSSTGQDSSPLGELEGGFILFQDARLDSVMMQIDQYYKVETRFTDENLRQIRLLFKWHKQHSLDEVLQRLNGFERFQIRREENNLIVEQPQAEQ